MFVVCNKKKWETKTEQRAQNLLSAIVKRHNDSKWRRFHTLNRETQTHNKSNEMKKQERKAEQTSVSPHCRRGPYFISLIWGCIKLDNSNLSFCYLHGILTFYRHRNVVHFALDEHRLWRLQCFLAGEIPRKKVSRSINGIRNFEFKTTWRHAEQCNAALLNAQFAL